MKKILFISGSVGLGHVSRDLAIAAELRRISPDVEVSWLAASPASEVIKNAGERLFGQPPMRDIESLRLAVPILDAAVG